MGQFSLPLIQRIAVLCILCGLAASLSQFNAGVVAGFPHIGRPDGALNFADMGFPEQEHAKAGLADTSANGLGQLAFQQEAVEIQVFLRELTTLFQLTVQAFGIYANAHT